MMAMDYGGRKNTQNKNFLIVLSILLIDTEITLESLEWILETKFVKLMGRLQLGAIKTERQIGTWLHKR